jgi:hypothetical protein
MTPPTEWLTLDAAAARIGCSTRTLQRRVAAGEVQAQRREDGRTLVAVEALTPCPSPVMPPEVVERLQRQADDTNRVAALAALATEQTALAYRERLQAVESSLDDARTSGAWWRRLALASVSVAVSSAVAVGYLSGQAGATARQVSDMQAGLDEATDARKRLADALQAMTEARQASDAEADRLRDQVVELQALVGVDPVDRPTLVAAP